uniref:Uncharacterized protein n=1 Tax=Anguilla anguilla TaxID=7936 RepID=A0A0E9V3Z1_ANGAN
MIRDLLSVILLYVSVHMETNTGKLFSFSRISFPAPYQNNLYSSPEQA